MSDCGSAIECSKGSSAKNLELPPLKSYMSSRNSSKKLKLPRIALSKGSSIMINQKSYRSITINESGLKENPTAKFPDLSKSKLINQSIGLKRSKTNNVKKRSGRMNMTLVDYNNGSIVDASERNYRQSFLLPSALQKQYAMQHTASKK